MKKKQKEIFLENEGNSWFYRNHKAQKKKKLGLKDPIIQAISKCLDIKSSKKKFLLEIGCGEAKRLHWISKNLNFHCFGVEPSKKAVTLANSKMSRLFREQQNY